MITRSKTNQLSTKLFEQQEKVDLTKKPKKPKKITIANVSMLPNSGMFSKSSSMQEGHSQNSLNSYLLFESDLGKSKSSNPSKSSSNSSKSSKSSSNKSIKLENIYNSDVIIPSSNELNNSHISYKKKMF